MFDAARHGNAAAVAVTVTADLNTTCVAMRRNTGLSGAPIEVAPRFVLVPPELETAMQRALADI
ncbi:hypothetical protein [Paracoccus sp. (in: a-proteobacteria)]|uniref:hypothetical protein n=1 Tax=Paracoccus sp. TaxID=267 RepID=UPI00396CA2DA